MATVYLFCGLPGSGKTTLARTLERKHNAVRFTLDHRMLARHDLTIFDEKYGELARAEKEEIWQEALDALNSGRDVILDWSLWNHAARAEWTARVVGAGHRYALKFLPVPLGVLYERLSKRNSGFDEFAHYIPLDELERFSHVFEEPGVDEGIPFDVVAVDG